MRIATVILLVGAVFAPVVAQEKKAKAKKDPAPAAGIKVVSVVGRAQKLVAGAKDEKDKWVSLQAGETLEEKTIIRTGFKKTKVVIKFPDGSEFTIDRATKIGISEFRKTGDDVKAKLGLKYGAVRAQIEKGAGKTEYEVETAVATLSVRGSLSMFGFTSDAGLGLKVDEGDWLVRLRSRKKGRTYKPGQYADGKGGPAVVVWMLRRHSNISDFFGLTRKDQQFQRENTRGRGLIGLPGGRNTQGSTRLFKQQTETETETESEGQYQDDEP